MQTSSLSPVVIVFLSTRLQPNVKQYPSVAASSSEPVNRVMTVWAGPESPTPDIACVVGFTSIEITQLWRENCSIATRHRLSIPEVDRKKLKWPKEKTEIVSVSFPRLVLQSRKNPLGLDPSLTTDPGPAP